jgi:Domain of unknown function (DUF4389)
VSEHPVRVVVSDDLSRKRLTVFFRLILVIPHCLWLGIWGIGAFFAAIANWFATLVAGRSPAGLHRFLALYIKYATQVYAYLLLAASPYPEFDGRPGYPVDVEVAPPERQSRASVGFRLVLALPALLIALALMDNFSLGTGRSRNFSSNFYFGVAYAAAFLGWFACLALARMPRGLRDGVVWAVGFSAQLWAYLFVLTDRYPDSDPEVVLGGLPAREDPVGVTLDDDRRRSRLTVFFRLLLAFPHFVWLTLWGIVAVFVLLATWASTLVRGQSPAPLHKFLSRYLRYGGHVYAFLVLVANPFPGFAGVAGSYPAEIKIGAPGRQSRWTVAFRLLLALPAWLLAAAYGLLLFVGALLGWFAALVTGTMPRRLRNTGVHALRYVIAAYGYVFLLTGAYPYGGPCRVPGTSARRPPAQPAESAFG